MKFELAHYSYWVSIVLLMAGLYVVIAKGNLIKKMIGLNMFQVAVIMFYVSMGKIEGGTAPIVDPRFTVYSNPLPHVLMLTAIVVGVATTAVGLALIVRVHEAYDSIEDDEIRALQDAEDAEAERNAGAAGSGA